MYKRLIQLCATLLLAGLLGSSCQTKSNGDRKMKQANVLELKKLERNIKSFINSKDAFIAVALQDVEKNFYLGIDDTISVHAASTMKVPVMMEIYRQAEDGKFSLDDSLTIKNEFKSIVDGSIYSMDISEDSGDRLYSMIGSKESIRNLVKEMIIYSGNLATNLLIDLCGAHHVQDFMQTIGAKDIQVLRGVEDIKAFRAGKNNTTTAKDLAIIFQSVYDGSYWSENSRNEMIDILLAQHFNEKIPAKLPKSVKVAHKTGSITEIDHDAGIAFPEGYVPYILVVLTKGFEDHTEAQESIATLSRMVYDWYSTVPDK